MILISKLNDWYESLVGYFRLKSFAELYLAKSIDRADFSYREKLLRHKGLL